MCYIFQILFIGVSTSPLIFASSINLTKISMCPEVIITCSAINLPTTVFRWFFDGERFAKYAFAFHDNFPLRVEAENATLNVLLGGVNIQMEAANLNNENQDTANFISIMRIHNVSAVQDVGVTNVSCGSNAIRETLSLLPNRIPPTPAGVVVHLQEDENLQLYQVTVQWNKVVMNDQYCLTSPVNYTIIVRDQTSEEIKQLSLVTPDACNSSICSILLNPILPGRTCSVSVIAVRFSELSSAAISNFTTSNFIELATTTIYELTTYESAYTTALLGNSTEPTFSHSLNFENCMTTMHCSSTQSKEGSCVIQYGQNPLYEDLGPPISAPLNTSFPLHLMETSTLYYIQIMFIVDSQPVSLRTTYTTGDGPVQFTSLNLSLIGAGLAPLVLIVTVIASGLIFKFRKCDHKAHSSTGIQSYFFVLLLGITLCAIAASVALWIAFFLHIFRPLRDDRCDPTWQQQREYLNISAFVISIVTCVLLIVTVLSRKRSKRSKKIQKIADATQEQLPHEDFGLQHGIPLQHNVVYGVGNDEQKPSISESSQQQREHEYEYISALQN